MKTVKRYLSMVLVYSKYNIQSDLEYPAYLIGWVFANGFQFLFGFITILVVTTKYQPLGGWSFEQIIFLYGLGIISHGLSVVFFVQTWHMDSQITYGEFDRLLTRPINTYFQFSFSYLNFIGFTDMIPGLIIFIYACYAVGFDPNFINIVKILIVITGATLMRGGIFTVIGSLAFWLKRTNKLISVALQIFDCSKKYPISIYPTALQFIFTFLIPVGFICFYPASEFLGIDTGFHIPGSLCLWTLFAGIIVYLSGVLTFAIGIKKYESAVRRNSS